MGYLPTKSDPIMFLSSLVVIELNATLCVLDLEPVFVSLVLVGGIEE